MKFLLLILFLASCTKQTTWCEQWQVEEYEMKGMLCPTGRLDTVSECWNDKVREDLTGTFKKVDTIQFYKFLNPLKNQK